MYVWQLLYVLETKSKISPKSNYEDMQKSKTSKSKHARYHKTNNIIFTDYNYNKDISEWI